MQLRPLSDRVIIRAVSKEEKTASGIFLPDSGKERPEQGEVVAVGPGRLLDSGTLAPVDVKVGDKVVFKKYSPDEVKLGEIEYLVVSASDIMAVIE